jgi:hypothetical protein
MNGQSRDTGNIKRKNVEEWKSRDTGNIKYKRMNMDEWTI